MPLLFYKKIGIKVNINPCWGYNCKFLLIVIEFYGDEDLWNIASYVQKWSSLDSVYRANVNQDDSFSQKFKRPVSSYEIISKCLSMNLAV